jgi:hypothetical protein
MVCVYETQPNISIDSEGGPLTRESMVLFGLLMGGDYDTVSACSYILWMVYMFD